jgi:hypothetical protein
VMVGLRGIGRECERLAPGCQGACLRMPGGRSRNWAGVDKRETAKRQRVYTACASITTEVL